jgi:hypothetical protein
MRVSTFLLFAVVGLTVAAALFSLAAVLDVPALRLVAVAVIATVLVAREVWSWSGDLRGWLAMAGTLLGTIALLWGLQRIAG